MADSAVRRRKPAPADKSNPAPSEPESIDDSEDEIAEAKPVPPKKRIQDEDRDSYWLDGLRVLTFLFIASCGLSYLISSGESFFWGISNPPNYTKIDWWKTKLRGPLYLTPEQLTAYDGTDPSKPIYLAINGSIYDVSSNPRTYGKGGSYQYFAGVDAARSYVTGCFAEDRTPDMRGVEDMFLPLDDPSIDRLYKPAELTALKEQERAEAAKKVHEGLDHWVKFFASSPKYPFVGYVVRPAGWPGTEPVRQLCEAAQKNRMKRKVPGQG
ncbi:hypothetical protein B0T18DRAFT_331915 [Schizothecium vesticola]|uniref:Cytochrome b5 heme-binding domain-containing protein n=1 Tax=Schizothecium vesticola TaxID=314040 RepID=A0AA40EJD2_9PEZI|nr:hypothetical protein B0T18DRAFT_331915 [Schizothecium vesticola]